MRLRHARSGYVFLLSVLMVGAIATAVVAVLLLLSTSLLKSTISLERSGKAFSMASTCAERALLSLSKDIEYEGGVSITLADGTCDILPVGGYGPTDRTVCVQGQSDGVVRRMQIDVQKLFPQAHVRSWTEVPSFTECPAS